MLNIFTIVLNGMPYIRDIYSSLYGIDCRWTIVHGIAEPVLDTSWCRGIESVADDGTLSFLETIERDPRVKVLRQDRWHGKTEMCNAALATFDEPGTLMQMDCDEIWPAGAIRIVPTLFDISDADAAMFTCRYWMGKNRVMFTHNQYGNNSAYEWIRAWRFEPGDRFERHEPPILAGAKKYLKHDVTSKLGLVFDHYAYHSRRQIEFKSDYYGSEYDPAAWDKLQTMHGAVDISTVLPWVKSHAISFETP